MASALRKVILGIWSSGRLVSSDMGRQATSTGKGGSEGFGGLIWLASSGSNQMSPFSVLGSHSLLMHALNLRGETWWDCEFSYCFNSTTLKIKSCVLFSAKLALWLQLIRDRFRLPWELADRDLSWELDLRFFLCMYSSVLKRIHPYYVPSWLRAAATWVSKACAPLALDYCRPLMISWLIVIPIRVMDYQHLVSHCQGVQHCTRAQGHGQTNSQIPSLWVYLLQPPPVPVGYKSGSIQTQKLHSN